MITDALSTLRREATLDCLEREAFDLVVIGGGISGAGVAREAARRGVRVALLEAGDYAGGTSSKSSKLIHGGLRYLAQGEVGLVRETALERKTLHRMAPHLAEPRWMVLPTRSRAGLMKFRLAITAYEKLGAVAKADRHRVWNRADLEVEEPLLDRAVYGNACAYREYLTDDARLVIANLRAAAEEGAVLINYAPVDEIGVDVGRACGVSAVCALSDRRVRIRTKAVINAAGPWVEAVRRLEDAEAPPLLHLSKGIHLSISAERLGVRNLVLMTSSDGRGLFALRRGPIVYLGTTDTSWTRDATRWPEVTSIDVEYLLAAVPRTFAVEPIKPEEVVGAWAGLRPLVAQPGRSPTEISRHDEILTGPAGVVTVAGGKLTGYRPTARRALEQSAKFAGLRLAPAPEEGPLPGGDFDGDLGRLERDLQSSCSLSAQAAERLVRLYGSEAKAVVALGPDPIPGAESVVRGEIDWAIEREGACRVEDVVYRRTRVPLYDPGAPAALAGPVAERMASRLGWSDERRASELSALRGHLADDLSFAGARRE